jgi:hypothetical protein
MKILVWLFLIASVCWTAYVAYGAFVLAMIGVGWRDMLRGGSVHLEIMVVLWAVTVGMFVVVSRSRS